MLGRKIVLVSAICFAFSSQFVFAADGIVIFDDLKKACLASHTLCALSCKNDDKCRTVCSDAFFDCLGGIWAEEAPGQSRRPGAEIRTGAGLCLDVHAPEIGNNGGRVQAWACNGQPQQLWTYDPASRAVRVASGLCLDVHAPEITKHGGRVQIWACTGAPQQQWTPLPNGSLRNAGGFCLDVHAPDQTTNGGRVQVWPCNGSQQQRFTSGAF